MTESNAQPPGKRSVTFSLSTLMLMITVFAILAFLLRGLVFNSAGNKVFFVIGILAIPFCAIVVVSVTLHIRRFLSRRRRSRQTKTGDSEP